MTDQPPSLTRRAEHAQSANTLLARALRRARWTICGSGCGRRWHGRDRGRPVSRRCPGLASGCGCRRSGAPSASAVLLLAAAAFAPLLRCACRADEACAGSIATPACRIGRRPRSPTSLRRRPSDQSRVALWRAHVERALRAATDAEGRPAAPRLAAARSRSRCAPGAGAGGRDLLCRRRRAHPAHRCGVRLARRDDAGEFPRRRLGDPAGLYRQAAGHPAGLRPGEPVHRPPLSTCRPAACWWCAPAAQLGSTCRHAAAWPKPQPEGAAASRQGHRRAPLHHQRRRHRDGARHLASDVTCSSPPFRTCRRRSRSPRTGGAGPRRAATLLQDRGRLRRCRRAGGVQALKDERRPTAMPRVRSMRRRISRWCCRRRAPATASAQTTKDLTEHPWAGADVSMTLTARDEAGNEGRASRSKCRCRSGRSASRWRAR